MEIDGADTTFVLISAALVLLMTPALAVFYEGLVRRKNVLSTLMYTFITIGLISIQWVFIGYTFAFDPNSGFIGGLDWLGLKGVGFNPGPYAPTIPHEAFMVFQMMFAIITPALIIGAFVDRMKFSTFLVFTVVWATVVYDPIAHWVWGDQGWLRSLGTLDFAGGIVVHISAGVSALAAALVIGKRKDLGSDPMEPHDIRIMVLGAALLWFGWFGFNAGSALSSGSLAVNAFVVTQMGGAAASLTWTITSWLRAGKPSVVGAATGGIAGLAAVTPASGFVDPMGAIAIGVGVGIVSFLAMGMKTRFGFDDSLDVWACHGIGGILGVLATGLLAQLAINSAGANGLLYGNPALFGVQGLAVIVTSVYAFTVTFILMKVLNKVMGLRVSDDEENVGLDISQHGERVPV